MSYAGYASPPECSHLPVMRALRLTEAISTLFRSMSKDLPEVLAMANGEPVSPMRGIIAPITAINL